MKALIFAVVLVLCLVWTAVPADALGPSESQLAEMTANDIHAAIEQASSEAQMRWDSQP